MSQLVSPTAAGALNARIGKSSTRGPVDQPLDSAIEPAPASLLEATAWVALLLASLCGSVLLLAAL